jgi:hypothetical protein
MIRDLTVARIVLYLVALAGFALAIYAGAFIGGGQATSLLLPVFAIITAIYFLRAGRFWWVAYPLFVAFTGVFWVGFKIYSFELGLALTLIALVVHLAMGGWEASLRKDPLPHLSLICFLFIFLHGLASVYWAKYTGEGGINNITRSYSEYLWPLIFLFAYARYGNNDGLPWALNLFLGMFIFRAALSVVRIFLPQMEGYLFIPGINFIPLANLEADLRESCLAASYILLGKMACQKNWAAKAGWGLLWLAAGLGIAFGGGRVAVPLYALGPLVLAAIYRKWVLLAGTAVVLGTAVAYLNLNPQILDGLPKEADTARRALSGLIFREDRAGPDEFATGQSDEFHRLLREAGYKKWTEDAASLFVGYPIRKFDYESYDQSVGGQYLHQLKVDAAVATGRYEKGLWIYLAVFGITGFSLYLGLTFCLLARPTYTIWRNGIEDAGGVFGFFAITSMFGWLITSNIKSGYLSPILFTGTFAYFWSLQARTIATPWRHEEKALPAHALAQYSRQPPSSGPLP